MFTVGHGDFPRELTTSSGHVAGHVAGHVVGCVSLTKADAAFPGTVASLQAVDTPKIRAHH
eukprot:5017658-Prymnesium_polylepis.1